jgi:hypothetical protein
MDLQGPLNLFFKANFRILDPLKQTAFIEFKEQAPFKFKNKI